MNPELLQELLDYLDTLIITGQNIGHIRRSCFMPWSSEWNGIVRDQTAKREKLMNSTEVPGPASDRAEYDTARGHTSYSMVPNSIERTLENSMYELRLNRQERQVLIAKKEALSEVLRSLVHQDNPNTCGLMACVGEDAETRIAKELNRVPLPQPPVDNEHVADGCEQFGQQESSN